MGPAVQLAMLECAQLSIAIPGRTLVRGLSLRLLPGEIVCLLGPNGVGKTLTLETLAGLRDPSAGVVTLDGTALARLGRRAIARRLGLLLQEDAQAFPASVLKSTLMGRHPYIPPMAAESPDDIGRARAALDAMGLGAMADRTVATLSGGERRRLALARILTQDPAVLLLDEPINHLDPRYQVLVLQKLRALAGSGRAVLMTLHEPWLAMRFAQRAVLMFDDGSWETGPCGEVLSATNLARLFATPYDVFQDPAGTLVPLPSIQSPPGS